MRFHKIQMVGKLLLQKVSSFPIFDSSDEGRLVYSEDSKDIYFANDERWKKVGGGSTEITTTSTSGDTLENGYLYPVDTSSDPVTLYLPSSPSSEDVLGVYDSQGTFSLNNLTVNGNGNTIVGSSSVSFSSDNSIVNFIYSGSEWKLDIGGSNTITESSGLNFSVMETTTDIETSDNLVYEDSVDGEAKRISSINFLENINPSTLTELDFADSGDYLLIYDYSDGRNKRISTGKIVTASKHTYPYEMSLDDSDIYSSFGSAFGAIQTVDFDIYGKGSIWFSFNVPEGWITSKDINLDVFWNVTSNDPDKDASLNVSYWNITDNSSVDIATPDVSLSNTLNITSDEIDKVNISTLNSISKDYLSTDTKIILMKVSREPSLSSDTYGGKLKVLNFKFYQL